MGHWPTAAPPSASRPSPGRTRGAAGRERSAEPAAGAGVTLPPTHSIRTSVRAGDSRRATCRITVPSIRSPGWMNSAVPPPARARPLTRCWLAAAPMPKVKTRAVCRCLRRQRDDGVGVGDLAVGQHDDLSRQTRPRRLAEHELQGGQDLRAAEIGVEAVDVPRRASRGWPRRTARLSGNSGCVRRSEADDVEAAVGGHGAEAELQRVADLGDRLAPPSTPIDRRRTRSRPRWWWPADRARTPRPAPRRLGRRRERPPTPGACAAPRHRPSGRSPGRAPPPASRA